MEILTTDANQRYVPGIETPLLLETVLNTCPYIFELETCKNLPHVQNLATLSKTKDLKNLLPLYFKYCISAHWTSVATPVPSDVDQTIRLKLWQIATQDEKFEMAQSCLENIQWDERPLSARYVYLDDPNFRISGHYGEWYSIMVAAYADTRKNPSLNKIILETLLDHISTQQNHLANIFESQDGIKFLKSCVCIAHNLGDLDRVIDIWHLPPTDPLVVLFHKLGHEKNRNFKNNYILYACELNKLYTAEENHRHLFLRKPKALRSSPDFLIPLGPFFDDYGKKLAKHPSLTEENLGEIIEALIYGFTKLPGTKGYARALRGIEENYPGGFKACSQFIPKKYKNIWQAGNLRNLCSVNKEVFEKGLSKIPYSKESLKLLNSFS